MRTLLIAISLAFTCAAAAAQTADRPALLARLIEALPKRESPSSAQDTVSGIALRARLVQAHPDRVDEIDAALSRMSVCLDTESARLIRQLMMEAADAQLTDNEISALVAFYEGPEYRRLDAFMHQLAQSPDLPPPEEREWAQQVVTRPELQKFAQLVLQVGLANRGSPAVEGIVRQCGDVAIAELRAAGVSE